MTHLPPGTGARATGAGIITRTGADWINPPAPLSQWQHDRASAPFERAAGEPRWTSLLAVLIVAAFFVGMMAL